MSDHDRELAAMKAGLPTALGSRLQGETLAELEADAFELARLIKPEKQIRAEQGLILARKALKNAKSKRLLGDGDTSKEVGDERSE